MPALRYQAKPDVTPMTRSLQDHLNPTAGRWFRNTAELSPGMVNARASSHGRGADNGQCSNPSHNDGCHRLYKAAVTGRTELPALVLTAAETLSVRHEAVLGPGAARRVAGRKARR
jgi:hypothetical protein